MPPPLDIAFDIPELVTDAQRLFVSDAEALRESLLPGYRRGIAIDAVTIDLGGFEGDGESGLLAFTGPSSTVAQAGFVLPTAGFVDFDLADLARLEAEGGLFGLLLHEVAHVLGFGTLLKQNGLCTAGRGSTPAPMRSRPTAPSLTRRSPSCRSNRTASKAPAMPTGMRTGQVGRMN